MFLLCRNYEITFDDITSSKRDNVICAVFSTGLPGLTSQPGCHHPLQYPCKAAFDFKFWHHFLMSVWHRLLMSFEPSGWLDYAKTTHLANCRTFSCFGSPWVILNVRVTRKPGQVQLILISFLKIKWWPTWNAFVSCEGFFRAVCHHPRRTLPTSISLLPQELQ